MGLARSLLDKGRLFFLLRKQNDSAALRAHFAARHGIEVGLYSYGCFDRWRMPGPLKIGRYCSFAKTVRVVDANHPVEALTTHPALYEKQFGVVDRDLIHAAPLIVEDDVWVGHNVVILPGCKFIGRGAIIGAGSIVTRDIQRYEIVAGVPARHLRQRFSEELAAAVEATRWWEMDMAQLRELVATHRDTVYAPTAETLAAAFADRRPSR
ncbi:CatB-related O-acetyltransferase [Flavisphingomonas formosensis]|uniref:CatB-related O-acetyltransferase n=1 Tax=Flavisphingomonas formosensis TaxID=861534 RepID=UPI0012FBDF06|nr:CatB-related O-acetyltransferase [Sphingomonas formosensis]